MKIHVALTIAGSDSGGGAGIQADLKTFAAFGVHGTTAITTLTAQNTQEVRGIYPVTPEFVRLQIKTIIKDMGIDAAKTGMLYNAKIINTVSKIIDEEEIPTVVDPVMIAKSSAKLLLDEAINALKKELIPNALIITPNIPEAEVLTGHKISNLKDMEKAAEEISEMGPEGVVIKGGHMEGDEIIDILYHKNKFYRIRKPRIKTKNTHGTGCTFSAAITALIAKKKEIPEAVEIASKFMNKTIIHSLKLGKGYGPVNPIIKLSEKAAKYETWQDILDAMEIIEGSKRLVKLIPEVRMNIGEAIPDARTPQDICAIEGRITVVNGRLKAAGYPKFGASRHVANIILAAMEVNEEIRAAMNIRYSKEILDRCRESGMKIVEFNREKEPREIKMKEGSTLRWGIKKAMSKSAKPPDIIYDTGEKGKEPMIRVLGKNAKEVLKKTMRIIE